MAALTGHLQRQAEQAPTASYYNVALLKYQVSGHGLVPGQGSLPGCPGSALGGELGSTGLEQLEAQVPGFQLGEGVWPVCPPTPGACLHCSLLPPAPSQFSRLGPSAAPLQLSVRWDCAAAATQVRVEYAYNAGAMAAPAPLANVQVLLPVEEPVANIRLQPAASW